MKPMRHIFTDFGNVMLGFDNGLTISQLAAFGHQPPVFIDAFLWHPIHGLWREFETGRIAIPDFRDAVRRECLGGEQVPDDIFDDIHANVFTSIDEVRGLWARLRNRGLTVTGISNVDFIRWERMKAMGLHQECDHLVLSCVEGAIKPSTELIVSALERSGADPEEAVFIDDKPENLEPAVPFGIRVHQYENFQGLLAFLEANGLGHLLYAN